MSQNNTIFIGHKNLSTYEWAIVKLLQQTDTVQVKARGSLLSKLFVVLHELGHVPDFVVEFEDKVNKNNRRVVVPVISAEVRKGDIDPSVIERLRSPREQEDIIEPVGREVQRYGDEDDI
jgi:hypothetical protein